MLLQLFHHSILLNMIIKVVVKSLRKHMIKNDIFVVLVKSITLLQNRSLHDIFLF